MSERGSDLAVAAHLGRVRDLGLSRNRLGPADVARLTAAANLAGLRSLSLRDNNIGAAGVQALASCGRLGQLAVLDLEHNLLDHQAARALARSEYLEGLTELSMACNPLGPQGTRSLARACCLARLSRLDLGMCRLGPEGAQALATETFRMRPRELELCGNDIGNTGAVALASSPHLLHLHRLGLERNNLGNPAAAALASSAHLAALESLSLGGNHLGDEALAALARSPRLTRLHTLSLPNNRVEVTGVAALASSASLPALRRLDLARNPLGDAGVRALLSWPGLRELRHLNLAGTQLGDEGLCALARSASLSGLLSLNLAFNSLGDKGCWPWRSRRTLARCGRLTCRTTASTRRSGVCWPNASGRRSWERDNGPGWAFCRSRESSVLPSFAWSPAVNETEWLNCNDPFRMTRWLKRLMTPRQFRLFACACCRSTWDELTAVPAREAVETLERYADKRADVGELDEARRVAEEEMNRLWSVAEEMSGGWVDSLNVQAAVLWAAIQSAFRPQIEPEQWQFGWYRNGASECRLFRDIFGNPFRKTVWDPLWEAWDGGALRRLAEGIYAERRFGDLPILGDALEDAGCTDDSILSHCRASGEHVRGCWVVDWLSGQIPHSRAGD